MFIYFDIENAVNVQHGIIEKPDGARGVLNIGLIENVLEHIQDLLFEIISSILYELDFSEELKLKIIASIS
jgi:hypothetical protein